MKKIGDRLFAFSLLLMVSSCKKDDAPAMPGPKVTTGVFVLSEGTFSGNNTTLTYYNFSNGTASTDFFANANGSKLGDTGNDLLVYGSKLYIVMNVSSYVEVADVSTAKNIARIDFKTSAGKPRQPRYAVPYKNKVLVSSYDGTVAVIDTAMLTVDKFVTVGSNPEQLVVSGDKLYVANSGGLSTVFDSTLSVVDLSTFTETKKITVGINPGSVAADDAGNVYVSCTGDYNTHGPSLVKVSTSSGLVTKSADTAVGKIKFYNGLLYITGGYFGAAKVRTLSTTDFKQTSANFITDSTVLKVPYGISIDGETGDVYVSDAVDYKSSGQVYCFDKNGKKKFSFSVAPGINPNTIALIKQ